MKKVLTTALIGAGLCGMVAGCGVSQIEKRNIATKLSFAEKVTEDVNIQDVRSHVMCAYSGLDDQRGNSHTYQEIVAKSPTGYKHLLSPSPGRYHKGPARITYSPIKGEMTSIDFIKYYLNYTKGCSPNFKMDIDGVIEKAEDI